MTKSKKLDRHSHFQGWKEVIELLNSKEARLHYLAHYGYSTTNEFWAAYVLRAAEKKFKK